MCKSTDKVIINSFYPIIDNKYFTLYDENIAKNITLEGEKVLLELDSKIKTFKL